jgi:hypothetical protein
MTNSPKRRIGLIGYNLEIVENVPLTAVKSHLQSKSTNESIATQDGLK